jgi:carbon monoxide dehydrogenase subunit G
LKIEGQFVFSNTTQDAVWSFLTSPDRIASCLPGCEKLVPLDNGSYEMTLSIGIGAIRGKFTGNIKLHDVHPMSEYRMSVSGSGSPGFVNGEGTLRLEPVQDGTHLSYSGNVSAGGAIASVGQRMIGGAARMVIDQFFKCALEGMSTRKDAE